MLRKHGEDLPSGSRVRVRGLRALDKEWTRLMHRRTYSVVLDEATNAAQAAALVGSLYRRECLKHKLDTLYKPIPASLHRVNPDLFDLELSSIP